MPTTAAPATAARPTGPGTSAACRALTSARSKKNTSPSNDKDPTTMNRKTLIAFAFSFFSVLVLARGSRALGTPDGKPPSLEVVCDGLQGKLYGLCTAYCEAMDCIDPNQKASDTGCGRVRDNFMKASGGVAPPCDNPCARAAAVTGENVGNLVYIPSCQSCDYVNG